MIARRRFQLMVSLVTTLNLLCPVVHGDKKGFIQPCPDAGGYRGWLGGPNKDHLGHDYNASAGTEVKAIADGTVWYVGLDISGFGSEGKPGPAIWIRHRLSDGQYFYALYGHIQPGANIRKDVEVKSGQIVGIIIEYRDKKTNEDISHLHLGIWNSDSKPPLSKMGYGPLRYFTDPVRFLRENKPYIDEAIIEENHAWPMIRYDAQHAGRSPYLGPGRPSLKWKIRSSNCRWVAIAKEGTIYGEFSSEFGGGTRLCAIGPDGRFKWKSEVGYAPLAIADTGIIYVVGDWRKEDSSDSRKNRLWAITPRGTIQLEREIDTPLIPDVLKRIAANSLIIGNDGTIYSVLGNRESGILYSFSKNGALNWKFLFAPAEFGRPLPAIHKDGTIYLISKEKGSCFLNAITPDGKLKWRYEISIDNLIDWKIEKEIAKSNGKNKSYSAQYRQQRRTFLGEHGFPILAHYDFPQLVIGDDGSIYLVVVGDFLCAISPEGSLRWKKWRIDEGDFSNCSLPAIGLDGTIYLSTTLISLGKPPRQSVIAFEPNGQFKWSFIGGVKEIRTPLTVDANGTIYFADEKGIIYAINSDGQLKWRFPTDQPANAYLSGGTIAIGNNGTLYFLGSFTNHPQPQYGYLYAIGEAD